MHSDVRELRDFYARPLGHMARRLLGHRIRARWRRVEGLTVVGLGFTTPYLGSFRGEAARLLALMPAAQGALVWPPSGPTASVMAEEDQLPLPDNSVDRLLVAHCLEVTERPQPMMREIWRVLAPEGRLLMIVPNRRGVWARRDSTPFGNGRPYSRSQLERLLKDALLTPIDWVHALHMPPIERPIVMRSALAFERLGARISPTFSGVIMVEARKETSALIATPAAARRIGNLITIRGG